MDSLDRWTPSQGQVDPYDQGFTRTGGRGVHDRGSTYVPPF